MVERRWYQTVPSFFYQINKTMCLYPRLMPNPKYKPNKKNGGTAPKPSDKRLMSVPIGCGICIECRKQKAREWKIRMSEELAKAEQNNIQRYFITLTFSNEALKRYMELAAQENYGEADENTAAKIAVRHWLERWRKKFKTSVRHWLITELGHEGTDRIHLHGILITNEDVRKNLLNTWKNGWVDIGTYCNRRTINYIVKYVTKIDNDHKEFKGKIMCSPGLGNNYIKKGMKFNAYKPNETKEYYRSVEGYKMNLPMYYRNHIYTEEQKEKLWLEKMDKKEIYILGTKYPIRTNEEINIYIKALKEAQKTNERNGYGKPEWNKKDYKKGLEYINNY